MWSDWSHVPKDTHSVCELTDTQKQADAVASTWYSDSSWSLTSSAAAGFLRNSTWVKSAPRSCGRCSLRTWNTPWRVRLLVCVCVCVTQRVSPLLFLQLSFFSSPSLPPVLHKIDHYRWNHGEISDIQTLVQPPRTDASFILPVDVLELVLVLV